jgi:hypothetical protein
MLEVYREKVAPPQDRTPAVPPKLQSWTGRVWRSTPDTFQLLLKLDASVRPSDVEHPELRAYLTPFATELASFPLYLDYGAENRLPLSWAVRALTVEHEKHTFARFYDFLETVPAHVLLQPLPQGGAQSDFIFSVIPYILETNRLVFAITDYDLGFHNRIG